MMERRTDSKIRSLSDRKQPSPDSLILYVWGSQAAYAKQIMSNVTVLGAGENHTLFVNSKNETYGLGSNRFGQLALPDNTRQINHPSETLLNEIPKVTGIFCGAEHTFVLTSKSEVYSMGLNIKGQLGQSMFENLYKPKLVVSLLPHGEKNPKSANRELLKKPKPPIYNILEKFQIQVKYEEEDLMLDSLLLQGDEVIEDIACGALHTLALSNKGRVFVCGYQNVLKPAEDIATRAQFQEIRVGQDRKIKSIAAGLSGSVIISDGVPFIWGKFGKLVHNVPTAVKFQDLLVTTVKSMPPETYYVTDAKVGDGFVVLLTSKGEVFTLGENLQGQLGCNQVSTDIPIKVHKLPLIKSIHAGRNYVLAVAIEDGMVYGWGANQHGQVTMGAKHSLVINFPVSLGITLKDNQKIVVSTHNTYLLKKTRLEDKPNQAENAEKAKTEAEQHQETVSLKEYKKLQYEYQLLKNLNLSLIEKLQKPLAVENSCQTISKFEVPGVSKPRTFSSNLEIEWKELKIQGMVSEGGYGIIYRAKWRETIVAVKKFKIETGQVSVRDFLSECHAMEAVRHPNIVMFFGACTKAPHYSIILEYCGKGSLWAILQNPEIALPWEQRRRISIEIAKAVLYLHMCNPPIMHRDLKSLNILLDDSMRVKIADFGWTKTLEKYMTSKIGTYQWMAPEVIDSTNYTQKSDVFSYAIILWEIAAREPPYKSKIFL